eukprot:GHVU01126594.1.p2 GENE.GHVU01126594.1~~GHVU01126594.1.p2  ORF type:complete len:122 (-),score=8.90 GHVU01126594.1:280-645(-)
MEMEQRKSKSSPQTEESRSTARGATHSLTHSLAHSLPEGLQQLLNLLNSSCRPVHDGRPTTHTYSTPSRDWPINNRPIDNQQLIEPASNCIHNRAMIIVYECSRGRERASERQVGVEQTRA